MATSDGPDAPPEFDTSQPTIARVYDALLGGKDNFAADREGAATYLKYVPDAGRCAIENREALVKGVQYLVRAGGDRPVPRHRQRAADAEEHPPGGAGDQP